MQNFTLADWLQAGLNETDVALIAFMARQEVEHKRAFANILGAVSPRICKYNWPFGPHDARGFLEYAFLNTRWGESGTIGWIPLLDNRASGNIIIQAIVTESRQEMTFRQYLGLFPYPVAFEGSIPQPWHWTLLSKWIYDCPKSNTPLAWPILPELRIDNQTPLVRSRPAITSKVKNLSVPVATVELSWDAPGKLQGPYGQKTNTEAKGPPTHALIVSQLNATSVPLKHVSVDKRTASFVHPHAEVFPDTEDLFGISNPVLNGTVFVSLLDGDYFFTPENLSLSVPHVVAGPALWVIS